MTRDPGFVSSKGKKAKRLKDYPKIFAICCSASGSFVRAKCSLERFFVFARAFARTARNCFHQKPNDTKCER